MQDSWAVLSILYAVMDRIKKELPTVTSTWIVTENVRNYQNYFLTVAAPFLTASNSVLLNALVHPETAWGKGLVDANFSVAMSHVHRWGRESGNDVSTLR